MALFDYDPLGYTGLPDTVRGESQGLLGSIRSFMSDPKNQAGLAAFGRALAQAGAPSRVGPTWGGGLSDAFAALNEGRQQYDTQQFERKFKEMKMREMETEAAKQQAEAERIQQAQQRTMALQKLLGGNTALGLGAQQGDVGPTTTNVARIPTDPIAEMRGKAQMAIGGGYMDEGMKMLKAAKDMRDKMELTPSGEFVNPYEPTPGKNYGKVDYLDLGGVKVPVLPSGQIKGTALQKSQTPDSVASNALGWANYALNKENQNMPVIQAGPNGEVFSVDRRKGIGSPVLDTSGKPLNKGEKPLTEYQGKSTGFGMRAAEADKIISDLGTEGVAEVGFKRAAENAPIVGGLAGAAVNTTVSAAAQKRDQAERDFVNAVLRQESGAAINKDEFDNARKQYFPRVGDSKEVIAQKAKNRQTAIDAFRISAGPGGKNIPKSQGSTIDSLLDKYK